MLKILAVKMSTKFPSSSSKKSNMNPNSKSYIQDIHDTRKIPPSPYLTSHPLTSVNLMRKMKSNTNLLEKATRIVMDVSSDKESSRDKSRTTSVLKRDKLQRQKKTKKTEIDPVQFQMDQMRLFTRRNKIQDKNLKSSKGINDTRVLQDEYFDIKRAIRDKTFPNALDELFKGPEKVPNAKSHKVLSIVSVHNPDLAMGDVATGLPDTKTETEKLLKSILRCPQHQSCNFGRCGQFGGKSKLKNRVVLSDGDMFNWRSKIPEEKDKSKNASIPKKVRFFEQVRIHPVPYENRGNSQNVERYLGSTEWQKNLMMARENILQSLLNDPRMGLIPDTFGMRNNGNHDTFGIAKPRNRPF